MPSEEHYDDSAFRYFALSVLLVIIIPTTLSYVRGWRDAFSSKYSGICGCTNCREKSRKLQLESRKPSKKGIFKFICWLLVWALFIYLLKTVIDERGAQKEVVQFDPYAILELDQGASPEEIKRAYRQLSLKWHPDKNKAPEAQEKYILIAKAHDTLTDPETREKWEKYGNPDGPQGFSIGIALPSFLVNNKNSLAVLGVYVVSLLIIFPTIVIWYWNTQKELAPNQINKKTMYYFYQVTKESMRFKLLIDVLSLTYEYVSQIQLRRSDEAVLLKLKPLLPMENKVTTNKNKKKTTPPHAIKNAMLFYTHFERLHNKLSPPMYEDLSIIVKQAHQLIVGLVELSASRRWLTPVLEAIQISQMVTQAVYHEKSRTGKDTDLLQLPHFSEETIKLVQKRFRISSTAQFVKLAEDRRKEFLAKDAGFKENQIKDVENIIKEFPTDLQVKIKNEVDDDDEELGITGGSVVTLAATIERPSRPQNEKNKEEPISVHAPFFPMQKNEIWWLIVGDERTARVMGIKRVPSLRDKTEVKIPYLAPKKAGSYQYSLFVMNDSYVGFDQIIPIKLNVSKEVAPQANGHEEDHGEEEDELGHNHENEDSDLDNEQYSNEDDDNGVSGEDEPDQKRNRNNKRTDSKANNKKNNNKGKKKNQREADNNSENEEEEE